MLEDDETAPEGARAIMLARNGHVHDMNTKQGVVSDAIGMMVLDSWENGYAAAVNVVRKAGGVDMALYMEAALESYWRSQGVDI